MFHIIISFLETSAHYSCLISLLALSLSLFVLWYIRSQKNLTFRFVQLLCLGLVFGITGWHAYHIIQNNIHPTQTQNSNSQNIPNGEKRLITITHHISNEVLDYKHWTGTYHPTTFVMHANGIHLDIEDKSFEVEIVDNILVIRYDYAFLNVKRKGAKSVLFDIPTELEHCDINFNWKDEWQVLIDGADPIETIKKEFNEDLNMKITL